MHAAAWKQVFDEFLRARAQQRGDAFVPFDEIKDYEEYVDGRPREDGVTCFLGSRGIELQEGPQMTLRTLTRSMVWGPARTSSCWR